MHNSNLRLGILMGLIVLLLGVGGLLFADKLEKAEVIEEPLGAIEPIFTSGKVRVPNGKVFGQLAEKEKRTLIANMKAKIPMVNNKAYTGNLDLEEAQLLQKMLVDKYTDKIINNIEGDILSHLINNL